ncbi:unnamed protein product, partial [Mesorhabditis belari]|uniref:Uncharacterized protein n=1 Tax=Mesorhabditis belari TaxID=2138241 RepID=A0AAF3ESG5_9BILA
TYNAHRRDVIRIAHDLAHNCQSFVALLEQRHQKSAEFSSILSDC